MCMTISSVDRLLLEDIILHNQPFGKKRKCFRSGEIPFTETGKYKFHNQRNTSFKIREMCITISSVDGLLLLEYIILYNPLFGKSN